MVFVGVCWCWWVLVGVDGNVDVGVDASKPIISPAHATLVEVEGECL